MKNIKGFVNIRWTEQVELTRKSGRKSNLLDYCLDVQMLSEKILEVCQWMILKEN